MDQESAVVVKDLYKSFKLPHEQSSGLKQMVVNFATRKKGYETQKVLNDISFEIKKGEFFGIVGRNGSGKSTLLKLLAGIYTPDKGLVQVNGSLTPFIELGVGFNPELTGRENVYMNGALLGFDHKQMDAMYDEIVGFAELEKFMDQKLKNYSSGMQVRLAFSIAIKANTDILLFDEVLAVGDENFQKKCLTAFRELKAQKKTIILVSHSTADIDRFCDRVLVVDKSKQIGVYSAKEATALYKEINYEESTTSASKEIRRWGTRELSIDSISVNKNKTVHTLGELDIAVNIVADRSSDDDRHIIVGMSFSDEDGFNIAGPNSSHLDLVITAGKKSHTFNYSVPAVPLNSGEYKLTVGVFDDTESITYDYWVDAKKFNVIAEDQYFGKVIFSNEKWS